MIARRGRLLQQREENMEASQFFPPSISLRSLADRIQNYRAKKFQLVIFASCFRIDLPACSSVKGTSFCSPCVALRVSPRRWPRRGDCLVQRDKDFLLRSLGSEIGAEHGSASRQAEIEADMCRIMSVPTIDIKLELQMLGVDHRDAFEKADLARRLAEARALASISTTAMGDDSMRRGVRFDRDAVKSGQRDRAHETRGWGRADVAKSATDPCSSSSPDGLVGGGSGDEYYSRDFARAIRMGKPAVIRELNSLGISHSRLSDLQVLARQYASGRSESRQVGSDVFRSDPEHDSPDVGNIRDMKDTGEETTRGKYGQDWSWNRWTPGRRGSKESVVSWHADKKDHDEHVQDQDVDGKRTVTEGRWRYDTSSVPRGGETGGTEFSSRASGAVTSREVTGTMRAPLEARAGQMSSRELMSALDSLGVHYHIPSARSELKEAFVSAVLERQFASGANRDDQIGCGIVPLNPYATGNERTSEFTSMSFDSYHTALEWARQLTFDDVIDELRYRGVEVKPSADYSYLTRLLADEVMIDEEMISIEGSEDYRAEVQRVMGMSSEAICRELEASGVRFSPDASKMKLAHKLAGANFREKQLASRSATSTLPRFSRSRRQKGSEGNRNRWWQEVQGEEERSEQYSGFDGGEALDFDDSDEDDAQVDLEAVARSVGGLAWFVAQEAVSFLGGAAATLLPEAFFAENDDDDLQRSTAVPRVGSKQARRTRSMRQQADGARRSASNFVKSSANRAGWAMVRTAANGVVRGAEAAADWAGGGIVAREHVLVFVAAFCLAFRRGIASSIALLILIRAGRITLERLLGGQSIASRGAASVVNAPGTVGYPSRTKSSRRSQTAARPRRAASQPPGGSERRSKTRSPRSNKRKNRSFTPEGTAGVKSRRIKTRSAGRRRTPSDDLEDEESDREWCVVM